MGAPPETATRTMLSSSTAVEAADGVTTGVGVGGISSRSGGGRSRTASDILNTINTIISSDDAEAEANHDDVVNGVTAAATPKATNKEAEAATTCCVICQESLDVTAQSIMAAVPCGHCFHEFCCYQWQYSPASKTSGNATTPDSPTAAMAIAPSLSSLSSTSSTAGGSGSSNASSASSVSSSSTFKCFANATPKRYDCPMCKQTTMAFCKLYLQQHTGHKNNNKNTKSAAAPSGVEGGVNNKGKADLVVKKQEDTVDGPDLNDCVCTSTFEEEEEEKTEEDIDGGGGMVSFETASMYDYDQPHSRNHRNRSGTDEQHQLQIEAEEEYKRREARNELRMRIRKLLQEELELRASGTAATSLLKATQNLLENFIFRQQQPQDGSGGSSHNIFSTSFWRRRRQQQRQHQHHQPPHQRSTSTSVPPVTRSSSSTTSDGRSARSGRSGTSGSTTSSTRNNGAPTTSTSANRRPTTSVPSSSVPSRLRFLQNISPEHRQLVLGATKYVVDSITEILDQFVDGIHTRSRLLEDIQEELRLEYDSWYFNAVTDPHPRHCRSYGTHQQNARMPPPSHEYEFEGLDEAKDDNEAENVVSQGDNVVAPDEEDEHEQPERVHHQAVDDEKASVTSKVSIVSTACSTLDHSTLNHHSSSAASSDSNGDEPHEDDADNNQVGTKGNGDDCAICSNSNVETSVPKEDTVASSLVDV